MRFQLKLGRLNLSFGHDAQAGAQADAAQSTTQATTHTAAQATHSYEVVTPTSNDIVDYIATAAPVKLPNPLVLAYGSRSQRKSSLNWNGPEFDFKEIAYCLATESLFRRTVDKYVELVWRNGYKLVGKNPDAVDYIKMRFDVIEEATGLPVDLLFRSLTQQLVTYSNCFIEKVRSSKASPGRKVITVNGRKLEPVAGYFIIDATSVRIAQDNNGRPIKYQQVVPGVDDAPEWDPEDIIHIYKDREAGLLFGTPMVVPVINDMKALRLIEENVEILVFNNAVPLTLYMVGDENNKPTDAEIRKVKEKVRSMSTEGMIVMPYYHRVETIGFEGRALNCEPYLEYFKNRVLAGLGVSEVSLGYTGSAGRQAAETIEKGMYNTTREIQNIIKINIEMQMIKELLLEGGFNWSADNKVQFYFPEIDIDDMIKLENHMINAYTGGLYNEDEARAAIGREPFTDEQRKRTYFELVQKPKALIAAVDEPYVLSTEPSRGERAARSLDTPTNQHGRKLNPGSKNDSYMSMCTVNDSVAAVDGLGYTAYVEGIMGIYDRAKRSLLSSVSSGSADSITTHMLALSVADDMIRLAGKYVVNAYEAGIRSGFSQMGLLTGPVDDTSARQYLRARNSKWIRGIVDSVVATSIDVANRRSSDTVDSIASIFDSNAYRLSYGARNELQRAYNIGVITAGILAGADSFTLVNDSISVCDTCRAHANMTYKLVRNIDFDSVPPGYMTHPGCMCTVRINQEKGGGIIG